MEKFHLTMEAWQDRLDSRWRQLSAPRKRRIVLYSFAGYLLITVAIVIQVVYEVGNNRKSVAIEHISNPAAGTDTPAKNGANIHRLKREDNEREQKRKGELSGE